MSKRILVINSGSTSLKYKVFNFESLKLIQENKFSSIDNHRQAIKNALREIEEIVNITVIGHRVVHGGKEFRETTLINEDIIRKLADYNELAPLHNLFSLEAIKACLEFLPNVPNIAVFDTAFFKDLPQRVLVYPLPYEYYQKYGIQKFGFHGISHQYAAEEAAKKLKKDIKKLKLITCHLGGGASITAIKNGQPIDTSMGFTPLEGLMMMTRPGDLDPGVILKIFELLPLGSGLKEVEDLLNFQSGIKGISGCNNFLELLREVTFGNQRAKLALEIFIYRIKKYIGAYYAVLNGCDALVFTGEIGAGKPETREKICQDFSLLKGVKIFSIPPNEELQIAREVKKFLLERKE